MIHSRTKLIGGVAITLCIVGAFALSGFEYMLIKQHDVLHAEAGAVFAAAQQERTLASLEHLVEDTQDERAELSALILTEDKVVDFLATIEGIGSGLGLSIETKSLTVVPGKNDFEEIAITLSLEGPEKSIRHALRLLESLPYRLSMERIAVSRVADEEGVWSATVELKVLKYKKS